MRTIARESLFKIIFASQFEGADESLKNYLFKTEKLGENDKEYFNRVLSIIKEHKDEFTDNIDRHSRLFPESRLFPADRSVLLIALAEIFYCEDIPDTVSVNEAANIASKYSSIKSASFVSGVLAEILKEKENV